MEEGRKNGRKEGRKEGRAHLNKGGPDHHGQHARRFIGLWRRRLQLSNSSCKLERGLRKGRCQFGRRAVGSLGGLTLLAWHAVCAFLALAIASSSFFGRGGESASSLTEPISLARLEAGDLAPLLTCELLPMLPLLTCGDDSIASERAGLPTSSAGAGASVAREAARPALAVAASLRRACATCRASSTTAPKVGVTLGGGRPFARDD